MADMLLTIEHNGTIFEPAIIDGIQLTMERRGSPSKLTFTVPKDGTKAFSEGDRVCFYYKGQGLFMGYVFTKKRNREHLIEVTAYDQLRYFQNKYTYVFAKKSATDIIKAICADFSLKVGDIEDTGYIIPSLIEENKTLFDVALDALDETIVNTGKMYILYDNFGSIELKELSKMATNVLIDEETAEDFTYTSSIDKETYNKIVLYYVDENTNDRIPYSTSDPIKLEQWGILQYFEEVKTPSIGQSKADSLLKLYCKKTRELAINNAFGNPSVRAGSMVVVKLNLGDIITSNYMVVEKVTHKFENDHYTMELTMNGNWGD